jgi:hypothetical protein
MNRAIALLFAVLALVLPGAAALAQADMHSGARVVARITWVEEWDSARGQWVRIEESPASIAPATYATVTVTETRPPEPVRFITRPAQMAAGDASLAQYGPFRVLDAKRAALVGSTDAASPGAFRAMLAAHPGLEVLEFVDAPGTSNDIANLALGRARACQLRSGCTGEPALSRLLCRNGHDRGRGGSLLCDDQFGAALQRTVAQGR